MQKRPPKEDHPLFSFVLNIVIPILILKFLSKDTFLGPLWGLICAMTLPVGYGIYALIKEQRTDKFAILGIIGLLLTGGFGLMKLSAEWFAIKEAIIPLLIGLVIIISLKTPFPLIKKFLISDKLFNVELLHAKLRETGNEETFNRRLVGLTWGLASSFFLSAALNYGLAKMILKSPPGSEAFIEELGDLMGISYVVIAIPCMLIMIVVLAAMVKTLTHLTGLKLNDLLAAHLQEEPKKSGKSAGIPAPELDPNT